MTGPADLRLTLIVFSFSPKRQSAEADLFSRRGAEYSGAILTRQQGFFVFFVIYGAIFLSAQNKNRTAIT
jgi:hypothetical protein